MNRKILAFSSSRQGNFTYLETAIPVIQQFLGNEAARIAFIPFASVDSYSDYHKKVSEVLEPAGLVITTVNKENGRKVIAESDCIITGGGNTFRLLHFLYEADLLSLIREKVASGTVYIGWSAGSNILGPTICTTNDMPIVEPQSFNALGLLPFQINPHYYSVKQEGFNGETRDDRLMEFLKMNTESLVYALPEGCHLELKNGILKYEGVEEGYVFKMKNGKPSKEVLKPGTETKIDAE